MSYTIKPIAHIESDYNEKFGIPRQPGLVTELEQRIVFSPEFSNPDALRGIEGFSHVWLIFGFSENEVDMTKEPVKWSPTVRPPRLGGGKRVGVWATRSPYRPNSLGLSCVKVLRVETDFESEGGSALALVVCGADLLNGTPIYDIKPYLPYADCIPEATGGFTENANSITTESANCCNGSAGCSSNATGSVVADLASAGIPQLKVFFPDHLLDLIDENKRAGLIKVLSLDPRGAYEKKPGYNYGLSFGRWDIKFTVSEGTLTVTEVEE